MKKTIFILTILLYFSCKEKKKESLPFSKPLKNETITDAKGFTIEKTNNGVIIIKILSPWPGAETAFTYALVPKEKVAFITLNKDEYDAIITVPVERLIATSTTHIPTLEALGVANKLVGFPNTDYISSKYTRKRIDNGLVQELGTNEAINTEIALSLAPGLVIGFGVNNQNKSYNSLKRSNIPVVYSGAWTEETPLGRAEWIKFFAPFFKQEKKADSIFKVIKNDYNNSKLLAIKATTKPTILSGALYKDIWYMAGGKSWMAKFFADAKTNYLWKDDTATGSLSLSIESVLNKGIHADFWLNPSSHTSYNNLIAANDHYKKFDAYKNKKIFSYANTTGATGGLLFYELGPNRPDLILKDFIHIFHPELLPSYSPFFFKPLK